jgi:positive regulator of sigma E activity
VVVVATLVNTFPLVIVVVSYATARSLPRNPYVVAGLLLVVAGANVIRIA